MNMYAYVGNDPVNGTDPSGLIDEIIVYGHRSRQTYDPPPGGFAGPSFGPGFGSPGGGGGDGNSRANPTKLCPTPTGSHIPSCVTVDADLTAVQKDQLESAFRDFILGNPGVDLSGFGKLVTGANAAFVAFAQAVAQFVGYAIAKSGDAALQSAWAYVRGILLLRVSNPDAGPQQLRGETFFMGDARIVSDILALDFGTIKLFDDAFSPRNNLAETIIHETLHLHSSYWHYEVVPGIRTVV